MATTTDRINEADEKMAPPSEPVGIDPFAFFPTITSAIDGLGGNAPGHDPHYVFHTDYVEAEPGPSRFIVLFHGLAARRGTLWLRVHMLPMEPGARAVVANSERIQLNRLIQRGSRVEIAFEGFRGMSFALHATIQGESDAYADGIDVLVDRPFNAAAAAAATTEVHNTAFGRGSAAPAAQMLSEGRAIFADPVSQIATVRQTREGAFREAALELGLTSATPADWARAFTLQALRRYGMVQPGARGLGIDDAADGLYDLLTAQEMEIVTAARTAVPRETRSDRASVYRNLETIRPLPSDLVNFDFTWSIDAIDHLGSAASMIRFVEEAMTTLRPGGLAVHVVRYHFAGQPDDERIGLRRADVERLLLILISRKHEIAQYRFDEQDALRSKADGSGAIGIIARKASSFV